MKKLVSTAAWLCGILLASPAAPAAPPGEASTGVLPGVLRVENAYARATFAGQRVAGGFLTIHNRGGADRLLSARSAVADTVEIHTMAMEGEVMRMRQLDALVVPAGQRVELKPGGLHLMFTGLKAPLAAGDEFALTLRFEKAGEVTVRVKVQALTTPAHVMKH